MEVDGGQHGEPEGLRRDARRDRVLGEAGYRVLRFWNHEIAERLDDVAEAVDRLTMERLPPSGAARRLRL